MRLKSNDHVPDYIRASSFKLVEGDGADVRAELNVAPEGWSVLSMFDATGNQSFLAAAEVATADIYLEEFMAFAGTTDPEKGEYVADGEFDHVGVQNGGEMLIELYEGDNLVEHPSPQNGLKWPDLNESGDPIKSINRKEIIMSADDLDKDPGNLYSKLFQLVDDSENVRAKLAMEDGSPALTMYDQRGTGRVRIGVLHGAPGVFIADKGGTVRIGIATMDSGKTGLFVYDQEGWLVYSISADADGDVGEFFG